MRQKQQKKRYPLNQCCLYKCNSKKRLENILKLNSGELAKIDFIIKYHSFQIDKKTGFPEEKSLKSIDIFGNTSAASIPTALVKNLADSVKGRSRFLLSGYGIGLSWGAVDCYMDEKDILPLVKTDEYFEDGYQSNDI